MSRTCRTERADVAARAVQAELLHPPEADPERHPGRARARALGQGEERGHPTAVVVDARTRRNGVQMRACHHHARSAARALPDHVDARALAGLGPDPHSHAAPVAKALRQGAPDDRHRQSRPRRHERDRGSSPPGARGIADQERRGARVPGVRRLDAEQAPGRLGQGHLARADAGQLLLGAAVADRPQRSVGVAGARVDGRPEVAPVAERPAGRDLQRRGALGPPRVAEALDPHAPPGGAQRARHVAGGVPVAGRAGRAGATVTIGDPLERAQVAAGPPAGRSAWAPARAGRRRRPRSRSP